MYWGRFQKGRGSCDLLVSQTLVLDQCKCGFQLSWIQVEELHLNTYCYCWCTRQQQCRTRTQRTLPRVGTYSCRTCLTYTHNYLPSVSLCTNLSEGFDAQPLSQGEAPLTCAPSRCHSQAGRAQPRNELLLLCLFTGCVSRSVTSVLFPAVTKLLAQVGQKRTELIKNS